MAAVGVVLVGGRSTRMGTAKAALDWHGHPLLRRTTGLLRRGTAPVLVVGAPDQRLPTLDDGVHLVADPVEGRGPLQGLATGLAAAAALGEAAFVCAVDLPFLHPRLVARVLAALRPGVDAALPVADGRRQPLAAAYRTSLAPAAAALLASGERRLLALVERSAAVHLDAAAMLADGRLAAVDGTLRSLRNVNTAEDYAAARAEPLPSVTLEVAGRRGGSPTGPPHRVRAAWLGGAAEAAGLPLDRALSATVDGTPVRVAADEPLAAGDVVRLVLDDG